MNAELRARRILAAEASRRRREIAMTSPTEFGQIYLSHHMEQAPSRMHHELFAMLAEASRTRSVRIAVAAPRGHAKSTVVSLIYILWAVIAQREPYTLLVSATREQAIQHLKNIRRELEANEKLLGDFPGLATAVRNRRTRPWRDTALQLPGDCLIRAIGSGEQIRGARQGQYRPSLIVCDDLEMPEYVVSADQRFKTREWFEKTLLKSGDAGTNVMIVGTVLHYDSLLANYTGSSCPPGWESRKYKALVAMASDEAAWQLWQGIYAGHEQWEGKTGPAAAEAYFHAHYASMLEGSEVLWPQRESLYDLMETLVREGRASFDSEKQNEPLDPEHCLFRPESFYYWDDEFKDALTLRQWLKRCPVYIAWDPSLGARPERGDYSAIVITLKSYERERTYVLEADLARRSPSESITRIVDYCRMFNVELIALETNGFQTLLQDQLRKELRAAFLHVGIEEMHNRGDKRTRVTSLQPMVEHGHIVFTRRTAMLLEQLRQFPLGAHDDGPDALEMAIRVADVPQPRIL